MAVPRNDVEYQTFIRDFESASIPKGEWHHPEHVAMAFWYLTRFSEEVAIQKIKAGIRKLNLQHCVQQTVTGGYHETWTIFFVKILVRFMDQKLNRELPLIEQMNQVILHLNDFRSMTRKHYSQKLIMSWEARTSWIEPDLLPI